MSIDSVDEIKEVTRETTGEGRGGVSVGVWGCLGMWGRKWEVVTEEKRWKEKKKKKTEVECVFGQIGKEQWRHTSTHGRMAGDKVQVVAGGGLQRVFVWARGAGT